MILPAVALAVAAAAPSLSPADEAAILRLLCSGRVSRDARGSVCTEPAQESGEPIERRWRSAWSGRFVELPDEWVITLYRTCEYAYCPFDSAVVGKAGGKWRVVRELDFEEGIGNDCLRIAGSGGALDRLACLEASGPNQGFMFERLVVFSFAGGEVSDTTLMARGQGGECFLQPPEKEVRADEVELLGDDGRTLSVRLRVRSGPCDAKQPDGNGPIAMRGDHVLRFVHDGATLKPDAATADLIAKNDWLQSP